jgi:uncharacterized protein (TIGR03437 family)
VRNAASPDIFAFGSIAVLGTPAENDDLTVKIHGKEYKYKVRKDQGLREVVDALVALINAGNGDANVLAAPNYEVSSVLLYARIGGPSGNEVTLEVSTSTGSKTVLQASGPTLSGGQDAALIAPYTVVTVLGEGMADRTAAADPSRPLPRELAGVQVYFDGVRAPLFAVAPDRITTQIPVEVADSTSANVIVRTVRANGRVTVSAAAAVPLIGQNPGIFADSGAEPRPGLAAHFSSSATGTVSVDGTAAPGEKASIVIRDRAYTYAVRPDDTLATIRDSLIALINAGDPEVEAFSAGVFTRVRLRARIPGPRSNGIPISVKSEPQTGSQVILTATNSELCCANEAGALVTEANPALPGETIVVYATGLGVVKPEAARLAMRNGTPYSGPVFNEPVEFVSSLAGAKTANVLYAGLRPGSIGIYEVHLELNSDLPTNLKTSLTIAQSFQVSNIVAIAVVNPKATE